MGWGCIRAHEAHADISGREGTIYKYLVRGFNVHRNTSDQNVQPFLVFCIFHFYNVASKTTFKTIRMWHLDEMITAWVFSIFFQHLKPPEPTEILKLQVPHASNIGFLKICWLHKIYCSWIHFLRSIQLISLVFIVFPFRILF